MNRTTIELMNLLKKNPEIDVSDFSAPSFSEYILSFMEAKNLTRSGLLAKTCIDRVYGYQILSGKKMPSKSKVMQLALALELNLEQTDRALCLSGNGSLYAKVKEDAIYLSCIFHHKSVLECSMMLAEAGLEPFS